MSKTINKIKPVTPKEIMENLEYTIHPSIIQAVNCLLKEKYKGKEVSIKQKDILKKAREFTPELTNQKIFDNHYMDFESIFRKAGWKVEYHSPDRDESFEEFFRFSSK